mgnify:CR=1 FL=1
MKKIDENGKLFGKISVLDLAFILCIILLAIFAFLKIGVNKNHLFVEKTEYIATYKVTGAKKSIVDSLSLNDKVYSADDNSYVGTIEKIDTSPAKIITETADGQVVSYLSPYKYDILITVSHKGYKDDKKGLVINKSYDIQSNAEKKIYTRYTSFISTVIDIKAKN